MARPQPDAAARMDGIYRTQRHIYDLSRRYFLLGRDRMIAGLDVPAGGTVLEIGCGTGRNLIVAARRFLTARLYGFDISRVMLETARSSIARAGLGQRITVAEGDAKQFSAQELFDIAAFDRIFVSYAVSMIPGWQQVLPAAWAALAPSGQLHIVDFGQQAGLPKAFRSGLLAWLARFTVVPCADLKAELAAFAARGNAHLDFTHLYRDYAVLARLTKPSRG